MIIKIRNDLLFIKEFEFKTKSIFFINLDLNTNMFLVSNNKVYAPYSYKNKKLIDILNKII